MWIKFDDGIISSSKEKKKTLVLVPLKILKRGFVFQVSGPLSVVIIVFIARIIRFQFNLFVSNIFVFLFKPQ